ncbi:hypothetical protein [Mariniblastus fucicola]|uniref:PPi-type phosphoenolpyruvate carboxykinase lobe 2 domain-containing protein n=1 Tax=Mariniblastus fucicola TaxID=980251 RepID=A0A5B9P5G4_9BACT|nr:hypothetical protein [Mariniblastus fucicola]QEG20739.1 hypothetical protein MFFC18_05900 [Mariniblastus fucicola]
MPLHQNPSEQELERSLGWSRKIHTNAKERKQLRRYISLQLSAMGVTPPEKHQSQADFSQGFLESLRERSRLLAGFRAPIDQRIESFLADYFADQNLESPLSLPDATLVLDRHGMARELSLPADEDQFTNELVDSRRLENGILNNPVHDRRTTKGTFHVVDGGLPIPGDKLIVPKVTFVRLMQAALQPPKESLQLPYSSQWDEQASTWVSLLLRPLVCPPVDGVCCSRSMETRFFVPGSLVSNLDFVESIFGNAGDPQIPNNDAALDVERWSGHTGCVILAPHLTSIPKKDLGLPHIDDATDRQKRDGMCWSEPDEPYNNGTAFKLTCRNERGVVVTLIADNYYGYCKKEVKTQISYATNLMGGVEEEHAGGALAFASYSLGDEFRVNSRRYNGRTFEDVARDYESFVDVKSEGYGIDRNWSSIIYIPENSLVSLASRSVSWTTTGGDQQQIPLSPEQIYIAPSGYQIRLEKHPSAPSWRLVGTVGEGIFCHKPCTVSGGGKSEISKSLRDYMLYGPIFVVDQDADFAKLDEIFEYDYQTRWSDGFENRPPEEKAARTFLDPARSLGSCIKMLSQSPDFNDQYNQWLASIPDHIYGLALIIKRFTRPGMEDSWREHFRVDIVNGSPGHELKMDERSLVGTYLRVGLSEGRWRTFKVRQDFIAASKVQMEDDISASTVVPGELIPNPGPAVKDEFSYKFVRNCEFRLFQRPDDAVHRGLDKQTEIDLARPGNFISNFEPLTTEQSKEIVSDVIDFDQYSAPMQKMLKSASKNDGFVVSSAHPRIVNGAPTKNPRYLQDRPDMVRARDTYIANVGMKLFRALSDSDPLHVPVGAVLSGRRNNPPSREEGIRSLAVYSPLHYQELPELMMDYIASLTGKSPSTTGAGSEGALTKGPFNMLTTTADLNATLVSAILTGMGGFSTPAGHVGPDFEVGHDISLLIPEVWCRMGPHERDPDNLIANGMMEKIDDFEYEGQTVKASRLGYRITEKFLSNYLSRVFDNPTRVFTEDVLRPELQDHESFADGILHITEAQQRVANQYLDDGSLLSACPPLQALITIMATGIWQGHDINSPEIRKMFTRDYLLTSDWYRDRLRQKQENDIRLWQRKVDSLNAFMSQPSNRPLIAEMDLESRFEFAKSELEKVSSPDYVNELTGTLGADPMRAINLKGPLEQELATSSA